MDNVKPNKRPRGRPQVYTEQMQRGSYRLPTPTIEVIRKAGDGNVTLGILRLAKMWEEHSNKP